jgi:ribosomal protein L11 methyltransferase
MTKIREKWFALEITVDSKAIEAIEFGLNESGALGTEINNLGKALGATVCIIGYFNEQPGEKILQNHLAEALRIYGFARDAINETEWRAVENKDWLSEWKKHWRPTETACFIIAPPWENVENTNKIVIRIEPNMAFGTGTHETTRLCLKAIEANYAGESFLDVGTGTGILAIAAAKLAAQLEAKKDEDKTDNFNPRTEADKSGIKENFSVNPVSSTVKFLACDTDADSIKIALENAELNRADRIEFYIGSIDEKTPEFNFVCANLTADVIIPMLPLLIAKTERTLLLSGILKEQQNLVTSELNKFQISDFKIENNGEWISILIVNG